MINQALLIAGRRNKMPQATGQKTRKIDLVLTMPDIKYCNHMYFQIYRLLIFLM